MTLRRSLLALTLLVPLVTGCRGLRDLEPRAGDSFPTQAGKVVLLVPIVAVGLCVVLVAGAASSHRGEPELQPRPRHPDIAPGRLEQLY